MKIKGGGGLILQKSFSCHYLNVFICLFLQKKGVGGAKPLAPLGLRVSVPTISSGKTGFFLYFNNPINVWMFVAIHKEHILICVALQPFWLNILSFGKYLLDYHARTFKYLSILMIINWSDIHFPITEV